MDWSKFWDWSNSDGIKTATAMLFSALGVFYLAAALSETWKSLLSGVGFEFLSTVSPSQLALGVFVILTALFRQIFFAVKPLEKGKGVWQTFPEVRQFQGQFPSQFLLDAYGSSFQTLTEVDFKNAWFGFFKSFDEQTKQRTLIRGSRCYPAFVLLYECGILGVFGLVVVGAQWLFTDSLTRGLLTVSALYLLLSAFFKLVWWRACIREFEEVNEQHKNWVTTNGATVKAKLRELAGRPTR